jgi:hypothetical protein
MKKLIMPLLICLLANPSVLFTQKKDSLAQDAEMNRLRRLGDSLHKVQLARDSANIEEFNKIAGNVNQIRQNAEQEKVKKATAEVLLRQEKEQRAKRRTLLWGALAFAAAVGITRIYFNRRKRKTTTK